MTKGKAHTISKCLFILGFLQPVYTLTNHFTTEFRSGFLIHGLFIGLGWYALSLVILNLFFVGKAPSTAV